MRKIPFYKIQGSGNDFIMIDNMWAILRRKNLKRLVLHVRDRFYSVGADGLIVIVASKKAGFKRRFFNSDGSDAEMCGNGARCAARFAYLKKMQEKIGSLKPALG